MPPLLTLVALYADNLCARGDILQSADQRFAVPNNIHVLVHPVGAHVRRDIKVEYQLCQ